MCVVKKKLNKAYMVKGRSLSYKPVIPPEDNHYQYLVYPHQDSKITNMLRRKCACAQAIFDTKGGYHTLSLLFYFIIVKWF